MIVELISHRFRACQWQKTNLGEMRKHLGNRGEKLDQFFMLPLPNGSERRIWPGEWVLINDAGETHVVNDTDLNHFYREVKKP